MSMSTRCEDCGSIMERAGCPNCNELDVINDLFAEEIAKEELLELENGK